MAIWNNQQLAPLNSHAYTNEQRAPAPAGIRPLGPPRSRHLGGPAQQPADRVGALCWTAPPPPGPRSASHRPPRLGGRQRQRQQRQQQQQRCGRWGRAGAGTAAGAAAGAEGAAHGPGGLLPGRFDRGTCWRMSACLSTSVHLSIQSVQRLAWFLMGTPHTPQPHNTCTTTTTNTTTT
jgi:hypothetical protein